MHPRVEPIVTSHGFAPLEPPPGHALILILGTLPGRESLAQQQYYAHPRNAFWRIMDELCGAGPALTYLARVRALATHGIAVWDVLQQARRPGSLDSRIDSISEIANNFSDLLARQPRLTLIAFNGGTAAKLFRRHVATRLAPSIATIEQRTLPSTSRAHAAVRYEEKLQQWRTALTPHLLNSAPKAP